MNFATGELRVALGRPLGARAKVRPNVDKLLWKLSDHAPHGLLALLALLLLPYALADMRIVTSSGEDDESPQELLISGPRMRLNPGSEMDLLLLCDEGEMAWLFSGAGVYWLGTPTEFVRELDGFMREAHGEDAVAVEPLLSGEEAGATPVRVTRGGQQEHLGYAADEYRVEYEQDGEWRTYDTVWVSPELLEEVEGETGGCMELLDEALLSVMLLFAGDLLLDDDMRYLADILTAPDYRALTRAGYPVRNQTVQELFGVSVETISQVQSVSMDALPAELFSIPEGHTKMSLAELAAPQ